MPVDKTQILHTVKIEGAKSFTFQMKGNPSLDHRGGLSIAHMVITIKEAEKIKGLAFLHGCTAEVWPMEGQNDEQTAIRRNRAGLASPERVWPSKMCPGCPWFDPYRKGTVCGMKGWEPEIIAELRDSSKAHQKAEAECPVYPPSSQA